MFHRKAASDSARGLRNTSDINNINIASPEQMDNSLLFGLEDGNRSASNASPQSTQLTSSGSAVKIIDIQRTRQPKRGELDHQNDQHSRSRNVASRSNGLTGSSAQEPATTQQSNRWSPNTNANNPNTSNNQQQQPIRPQVTGSQQQQKQQSGETLSSFESDYDLLVYLGETETEDLVDTERSLDYQDQTWRQSICGGASLAPTIDESLSELLGHRHSGPSAAIDHFDLLSVTPTQSFADSPLLAAAGSRSRPQVSSLGRAPRVGGPTTVDLECDTEVSRAFSGHQRGPNPRTELSSVNKSPAGSESWLPPAPNERRAGDQYYLTNNKSQTLAPNSLSNYNNKFNLRDTPNSSLGPSGGDPRSRTMGRYRPEVADASDELDKLLAEMSQSLDLDALSRYDTRPPGAASSVSAKGSRPAAEVAPRAAAQSRVAATSAGQRQAASRESILDEYDGASRMLEQMISDQLAAGGNRMMPPLTSKNSNNSQNTAAVSLSNINKAQSGGNSDTGSRDSPRSTTSGPFPRQLPAQRAPQKATTSSSSSLVGGRQSAWRSGATSPSLGSASEQTGSTVLAASRKVSSCSSSAATEASVVLAPGARVPLPAASISSPASPLEKRSLWRRRSKLSSGNESDRSAVAFGARGQDPRQSMDSTTSGARIREQLMNKAPPTPPEVDYLTPVPAEAKDLAPTDKPQEETAASFGLIRAEAADLPPPSSSEDENEAPEVAASGTEGRRNPNESQMRWMKRRTLSSMRSMREKFNDFMGGGGAGSEMAPPAGTRSQTPGPRAPEPPCRSSSIGSRNMPPSTEKPERPTRASGRESRGRQRRAEATATPTDSSRGPSLGRQLRERLSRSKSRLSKFLMPNRANSDARRRAQSQPSGPREVEPPAAAQRDELLFEPGDLARNWSAAADSSEGVAPKPEVKSAQVSSRSSSSSLSGLDTTASATCGRRPTKRVMSPLKRLSASLQRKAPAGDHIDRPELCEEGAGQRTGSRRQRRKRRARGEPKVPQTSDTNLFGQPEVGTFKTEGPEKKLSPNRSQSLRSVRLQLPQIDDDRKQRASDSGDRKPLAAHKRTVSFSSLATQPTSARGSGTSTFRPASACAQLSGPPVIPADDASAATSIRALVTPVGPTSPDADSRGPQSRPPLAQQQQPAVRAKSAAAMLDGIRYKCSSLFVGSPARGAPPARPPRRGGPRGRQRDQPRAKSAAPPELSTEPTTRRKLTHLAKQIKHSAADFFQPQVAESRPTTAIKSEGRGPEPELEPATVQNAALLHQEPAGNLCEWRPVIGGPSNKSTKPTSVGQYLARKVSAGGQKDDDRERTTTTTSQRFRQQYSLDTDSTWDEEEDDDEEENEADARARGKCTIGRSQSGERDESAEAQALGARQARVDLLRQKLQPASGSSGQTQTQGQQQVNSFTAALFSDATRGSEPKQRDYHKAQQTAEGSESNALHSSSMNPVAKSNELNNNKEEDNNNNNICCKTPFNFSSDLPLPSVGSTEDTRRQLAQSPEQPQVAQPDTIEAEHKPPAANDNKAMSPIGAIRRQVDEADARLLKALGHKKIERNKQEKSSSAAREPTDRKREEDEEEAKRLSVYENVAAGGDRMDESQKSNEQESDQPTGRQQKRERRWRKPPPSLPEKPAHLRQAAAIHSQSQNEQTSGARDSNPRGTPPDSPSAWSVGEQQPQSAAEVMANRREFGPLLRWRDNEQQEEKLNADRKQVSADERVKDKEEPPAPVKPKRRLVTMTSIIQDPNDELMMAAGGTSQSGSVAKPQEEAKSVASDTTVNNNRIPEVEEEAQEEDDGSDTDSSFAAAVVSRRRLLGRFEQPAANESPSTSGQRARQPKCPAFSDGKSAPSASAAGGGSLVKRLARNFDNQAAAPEAKPARLSVTHSPLGGGSGGPKSVVSTQRRSFELLDEPKSEHSVSSTWYDANQGTDSEPLDEAEVAKFLAEFESADSRSPAARQAPVITELPAGSSIDLSADDPFVTVADSTLEEGAVASGARLSDADDDTLNEDDEVAEEVDEGDFRDEEDHVEQVVGQEQQEEPATKDEEEEDEEEQEDEEDFEADYDESVSLSSSSISSESIPELRQRRNLQKLYHIVNEIYSSESKFVATLRLLNVDLRKHMSPLVMTNSSSAQDHDQVADCINSFLRHLPQLQALNENLLEELGLARDQWPKTRKVAHVLVKIGPFLKHYSTYIREFNGIQLQFQNCLKRYPVFADRVRDFEASELSQRLTVLHHLLRPIQRIPQYRLLLQQYLHHLKPDDPDYEDTVSALEVVSRVAEHANRSLHEGENFSKLLALQAKIVGKQRDIVQPGRLFVKEGQLLKICRKQVQPRQFILLNDALLYLTQIQSSDILYLNNELSLDDCIVSTPPLSQQDEQGGDDERIDEKNKKKKRSKRKSLLLDHKPDTEFSVCTNTRSFALIAKSREERDEWVQVLRKTIDEHLAKRRTFSQLGAGSKSASNLAQPSTSCDGANLRSQPSTGSLPLPTNGITGDLLGTKAPIWTPDARVSMCQLCTSSFSAIFRRHHCRACGKVVCSACSSNKAPLVYLKYKASRVCDSCFHQLKADIQLYYLSQVESGSRQSTNCEHELRRLEEHFRTLLKSQFVRHAGLFYLRLKQTKKQ